MMLIRCSDGKGWTTVNFQKPNVVNRRKEWLLLRPYRVSLKRISYRFLWLCSRTWRPGVAWRAERLAAPNLQKLAYRVGKLFRWTTILRLPGRQYHRVKFTLSIAQSGKLHFEPDSYTEYSVRYLRLRKPPIACGVELRRTPSMPNHGQRRGGMEQTGALKDGRWRRRLRFSKSRRCHNRAGPNLTHLTSFNLLRPFHLSSKLLSYQGISIESHISRDIPGTPVKKSPDP